MLSQKKLIHIWYNNHLGVSGTWLKFLAIICMTLDHIGLVFFTYDSWAYYILRFIGRFTIPTICFLLVEGFYYSKNVNKYAIRLLIFAVISQFAFTAMFYGWQTTIDAPELMLLKGNVLFTLCLALIALKLWHSKLHLVIKLIVYLALLYLSNSFDWGIVPLLLVVVLSYFRYNRLYQTVTYLLSVVVLLFINELGLISIAQKLTESWTSVGLLIPPVFWSMYNQTKGSNLGGRYFFYWYYPVHIIFLIFCKSLIT